MDYLSNGAIIGIGFQQGPSYTNALVTQMIDSGLITDQVLSIYQNLTLTRVTIGGYDQDFLRSVVNNKTFKEKDMVKLNFTISQSDTQIFIDASKNVTLDINSQSLKVSKSSLNNLINFLNKESNICELQSDQAYECYCEYIFDSLFPTLVLEIQEGFNITIISSMYLKYVRTNVCLLLVIENQIDDQISLGQPFFQSYYTIFDILDLKLSLVQILPSNLSDQDNSSNSNQSSLVLFTYQSDTNISTTSNTTSNQDNVQISKSEVEIPWYIYAIILFVASVIAAQVALVVYCCFIKKTQEHRIVKISKLKAVSIPRTTPIREKIEYSKTYSEISPLKFYEEPEFQTIDPSCMDTTFQDRVNQTDMSLLSPRNLTYISIENDDKELTGFVFQDMDSEKFLPYDDEEKNSKLKQHQQKINTPSFKEMVGFLGPPSQRLDKKQQNIPKDQALEKKQLLTGVEEEEGKLSKQTTSEVELLQFTDNKSYHSNREETKDDLTQQNNKLKQELVRPSTASRDSLVHKAKTNHSQDNPFLTDLQLYQLEQQFDKNLIQTAIDSKTPSNANLKELSIQQEQLEQEIIKEVLPQSTVHTPKLIKLPSEVTSQKEKMSPIKSKAKEEGKSQKQEEETKVPNKERKPSTEKKEEIKQEQQKKEVESLIVEKEQKKSKPSQRNNSGSSAASISTKSAMNDTIQEANQLYVTDESNSVDLMIGTFVNSNSDKIKIPIAQLAPTTYLVGTVVIYPYINKKKCYVHTEEIESYIYRNQKKEQAKVQNLMREESKDYKSIYHHLIKKNIPIGQDISVKLAFSKVRLLADKQYKYYFNPK